MTSRVRHRRQLVAGAALPELPLEPGELALNLADRQLFSSVSGTPFPMIGVRPHAASAAYALNDLVAQAGRVYAANQAIAPEAFTPAKWNALALVSEIAAAVAAHEALADPHPQYMTSAETDTSISTAFGTHLAATDPHPQYTTAPELAQAISNHEAAADPHPNYVTSAELAAAISSGSWLPLTGGTLAGPGNLTVMGNLGIGIAPGVKFDLLAGATTRARIAESAGTMYFDTTNAAADAWGKKVERAKAHTWLAASTGLPNKGIALDGNGSFGVGTETPSAYGASVLMGVVPPVTPTSFLGANQIIVGEATQNAGYRLQLGYALVGGTYQGSVQSYAGGVPSNTILQADGGGVGLGGSPAVKFHVFGAGAQARVRTTCTDGGGVTVEMVSYGVAQGGLGTVTNHPFYIYANSTPVASFHYAGGLAIGTTVGDWYSALTITRNQNPGTAAAAGAAITLNNRDTSLNGGHAGGILLNTYRDVANPHYTAGIWFTRTGNSGNLSSQSDIVFGTSLTNGTNQLPTENMRLNAAGALTLTAAIPAGDNSNRVPTTAWVRANNPTSSRTWQSVARAANTDYAAPAYDIQVALVATTNANSSYIQIKVNGAVIVQAGNAGATNTILTLEGVTIPAGATYQYGAVGGISFNSVYELR